MLEEANIRIPLTPMFYPGSITRTDSPRLALDSVAERKRSSLCAQQKLVMGSGGIFEEKWGELSVENILTSNLCTRPRREHLWNGF